MILGRSIEHVHIKNEKTFKCVYASYTNKNVQMNRQLNVFG